MILTGVLWLGSSVGSTDPTKFKQTRQLACSRVLRFTVDYKIFFFLGQSLYRAVFHNIVIGFRAASQMLDIFGKVCEEEW